LTARTAIAAMPALRDAAAARLRTARHTARHAARKPAARWAAGITAAAAIGAIAVTAAAPWASAATPAAGHAARTGPALRQMAAKQAPASFTGQPSAIIRATAGTAHASTAPAHPAAGKPASVHAATRAHAAARPAAPAKPSTIYDSVTPSSIPAGKDAAVYANGTYQATTAQVAGHKHVQWIDTSGSRPDANVLDIEPGDATPAGAAAWVKAKLAKDPSATAILYTFKSNWAPTTASISTLPGSMQSHVKYWIADPTGTPHILPGAAATQWYWGANYDISSAQPGFTS
jgi:hypothetical protein